MFEEDGGLVLIDCKTDAVDRERLDKAMARYRVQGRAYVLAVQEATGRTVTEVAFLFLQPGHTESLTDIYSLTAEAEAVAMEYLCGTRVVPRETRLGWNSYYCFYIMPRLGRGHDIPQD